MDKLTKGMMIGVMIGVVILIVLSVITLRRKDTTPAEPVEETIEKEEAVPVTVEETIPVKVEETKLVEETVEETVEDEPISQVTDEVEEETTYLGEFMLTAYCSCSKCCGEYANNRPVDEDGNEIVYGSIGKRLTTNYSIAVDPNVIPYGTIVIIDGHEYEAMDCGGAVKSNHIDVYFSNHTEAEAFGIQYADVYIKE